MAGGAACVWVLPGKIFGAALRSAGWAGEMPAASHRGDCCRLHLGGGVPLPRCGSEGCCLNLGMDANEFVGLALISC